jgi:uncharacterized Zn-binding protein involved in type VI secretion
MDDRLPKPEGRPAAKEGDRVVAVDIHLIVPPSGGSPQPVPHPFEGKLSEELSGDVMIDGKPVAVVGSKAKNDPGHVPQGGSFQTPPKNEGTVLTGARTVFANDKPVARHEDSAETCSDPEDLPTGQIVAESSVLIGE